MNVFFRNIISGCLLTTLAGCADPGPAIVELGLADTYTVARCAPLVLETPLGGDLLRWVEMRPEGDREVALGSRFLFVTSREGERHFRVEGDGISHEFTVNVVHEQVEYSPWIARVTQYRPAPGQFVNVQPRYEAGDSYADMLLKAEACIAGDAMSPVSLGNFGGYVTFAFDHTIANEEGNDLIIYGNAIYQTAVDGRQGGSAEPGCVWVAFDANGNGVADDGEWYQLAGSEHHNPLTRHGMEITYTRTPEGHTSIKGDNSYIVDAEYIAWRQSDGIEGYLAKNSFHNQDYYPLWVDEDALTFTGTLLPPNALDLYGTGLYYILFPPEWGYADAHPNSYPELCSFDISHVVDASGLPVCLPGIDFVRVVTGLNQYCHWIGESSTEVAGAADLHLLP